MSIRKQTGFTLIELSIVLVIIALVVAGIVVGKDLIATAGLRNALSQLEAYELAATTFKQKYNALPGDIVNPANFGLGTQGGIGHGGNGDGRVLSYRYWDIGTFTSTNQRTEIFNFWYHLMQAGLVKDTFLGASNSGSIPSDLTGYMPRFSFASNSTFIVPGTAQDVNTQEIFGNTWSLVSFSNPNAIIACAGNFYCQTLTAFEAWSIDAKLDDGIPRSGIARQMYPAVGPYWSGTGVQACDNASSGARYDVTGVRNTSTVQNPPLPESIDCSLLIKAKW